MTKDKDTDQKIDRIVDDLVTDEKTAEALKTKLHQSLDAADTHYARPEASDDGDDDMWDNMPV